jgi:CRP/FNR family transcriptional regulator
LLSRLKKQGLLRVANREIELLQPERLRAIAAGTEPGDPA